MHDRHLHMDTEQLMHGQILAELSKIRADLSIIKGRLASLELSTQTEQIRSAPIRISDLSQRSRAELERWNMEQDVEMKTRMRFTASDSTGV